MASIAVSETHDGLSEDARRRVRRRHAADRRLRLYGLAAIGLAVGLLAVLLGSLILSGHTAFVQTKVPLQVYVDPQTVDADDIGGGNYRKLVRDAFRDLLRSEEHTSELQSLMRISYAVFCLKKKNRSK